MLARAFIIATAAAVALEPELELGALAGALALAVVLYETTHIPTAVLGCLLGALFGLRWVPGAVTPEMGLWCGAAAWIALATYATVFSAGAIWVASRVESRVRLLVLPAAWTLAEIVRSHIYVGFDMTSIGYGAVDLRSARWLYQIFGVHGVSFALFAMGGLLREVPNRWRIAGLALALVAELGARSVVRPSTRSDKSIVVGLAIDARRFHEMRRDPAIDVVLAPEGGLGDQSLRVWRQYPVGQPALGGVQLGCGWRGDRRCIRNSVIGIARNGSVVKEATKALLVPGWESDLPFTSAVGPLMISGPSDRIVTFDMGGLAWAPLICFEAANQHRALLAVAEGSEIFFHPSSALWDRHGLGSTQIWRMARVRALETARPLVRVSNGRWNGWIDDLGAWHASTESPMLIHVGATPRGWTWHSTVTVFIAIVAAGAGYWASLRSRLLNPSAGAVQGRKSTVC